MDIEFIASIAVIAPNPEKSRELFINALGLPLEANPETIARLQAEQGSIIGISFAPSLHD